MKSGSFKSLCVRVKNIFLGDEMKIISPVPLSSFSLLSFSFLVSIHILFNFLPLLLISCSFLCLVFFKISHFIFLLLFPLQSSILFLLLLPFYSSHPYNDRYRVFSKVGNFKIIRLRPEAGKRRAEYGNGFHTTKCLIRSESI
jgi:hypothetical protein